MNQQSTTHAFAPLPPTPTDAVEAFFAVLSNEELMMRHPYLFELLYRAAVLPPPVPTPAWAHASLPMALHPVQALPLDALLAFAYAGLAQLLASQPQDVAEPVDALVAGMANVAIAADIPSFEPLDRPELPPITAAELSEGPTPELWDCSDFGLSATWLNDSDPSTFGYVDSPSANASSASSSCRQSVQRLDQGKYRATQPIKGIPAGPILFNGEAGVLLSAIDTLANGDTPAFDRASCIGVKPSIRFELSGFTDYSTQVNVRRGGRKDGAPITLQRMAELVREQFEKLMNHAESVGKPLRHRGPIVSFDKLVLLRIEHVAKGTIQPILGIIWDDG